MKTITLYTKNNCPQCKMTKRFLTQKDVTFEEESTLMSNHNI